jgi:hypothetical protein
MNVFDWRRYAIARSTIHYRHKFTTHLDFGMELAL